LAVATFVEADVLDVDFALSGLVAFDLEAFGLVVRLGLVVDDFAKDDFAKDE
jgi:hypothetical protein